MKNFYFLRATRRQTLPLFSPPASGRLLPAREAVGHKPALCFAPKGTAGCSPSAAGGSRCRQSILPSVLGGLQALCGSALPVPALLPCSPGAQRRCRGDKGLRLEPAIPCSCGLAENYCSAGEENNILFTVSPGTRVRAEQVLTHRLPRGAEMQSPAASSPGRWQSPQPLSLCWHRHPHGPSHPSRLSAGTRKGISCLRQPQAPCDCPPIAAGVGLAQKTPPKEPAVAATGKGPSQPPTPQSCQESREF